MNISEIRRRIIDEQTESIMQKLFKLLRAIKRNPIMQFSIARQQRKILKNKYPESAKKLIIYLTPSIDMVNGGVMSIVAHYEETIKMKNIHGAEVILCTCPDHILLLKYTKFKNNNYILGFSSVLSYFNALDTIMIHIPEYMADIFMKDILYKDLFRLMQINSIHINIMLQNVKGLKFMKSIKSMEKFGKVTCTTAHQRYTTLELRKELGVPLHLLSVRGDPENYNRKTYIEKDDLIIISPDEHPLKDKVLSLISNQLPKLRIQIISNITYEEYKKVIEKAKWALTFGEGLDGYFTETIFSGGISISVYNSEFFTEDFRSLKTIYDNYDLLLKNICSDIRYFDEKLAFTDYHNAQYKICSKYYTNDKYLKNLELFYKEIYTYK